ncbi:MAG TPA: hypothetical protein VEH84_18120 [Alphaproteobacteria bacterium]|nr:hypothetical protein [Alphaproteobacteria bacterium]
MAEQDGRKGGTPSSDPHTAQAEDRLERKMQEFQRQQAGRPGGPGKDLDPLEAEIGQLMIQESDELRKAKPPSTATEDDTK